MLLKRGNFGNKVIYRATMKLCIYQLPSFFQVFNIMKEERGLLVRSGLE